MYKRISTFHAIHRARPPKWNGHAVGSDGITADTALGLSRALGLTDVSFVNMQAHYDAEVAREKLATGLGATERILYLPRARQAPFRGA